MTQVGRTGKAESEVTLENTAAEMGSGTLLVYATPAMCALMEQAAVDAVLVHEEDGQTSVGISLEVKHLVSTPVGMKVRAVAEIIEEDGLRLRFAVKAYDENSLIGEGYHERFIVDSEEFLEKANAKMR
jgi:predicted thioesterase